MADRSRFRGYAESIYPPLLGPERPAGKLAYWVRCHASHSARAPGRSPRPSSWPRTRPTCGRCWPNACAARATWCGRRATGARRWAWSGACAGPVAAGYLDAGPQRPGGARASRPDVGGHGDEGRRALAARRRRHAPGGVRPGRGRLLDQGLLARRALRADPATCWASRRSRRCTRADPVEAAGSRGGRPGEIRPVRADRGRAAASGSRIDPRRKSGPGSESNASAPPCCPTIKNASTTSIAGSTTSGWGCPASRPS